VRPARPARLLPPPVEGGDVGRYHDSFMLHFTADGKMAGRNRHGQWQQGQLDTNNVRGVAAIRFLPDGTLVAADGYGNHRVSEWDPKTGKNVASGAPYGKPPSDAPIPHFNADSPQSAIRSTVRTVE